MALLNTFIIIQEGRAFAPVTVQSERLLVGSSPRCSLQLNDRTVPSLLGEIRGREDHFYFQTLESSPFDETKSAPISINGRQIVGDVALADGDVITIGQSRVTLELKVDQLVLRVGYQDAVQALSGSDGAEPASADESSVRTPERARSARESQTIIAKPHPWKNRQKLLRLNYLEPSREKSKPGTEFNWAPTRDLALPWPIAFLSWLLLVIAMAALVTFLVKPSIFAPGRVSAAHILTQMSFSPALAAGSNSGSCLNCHTLRGKIDQNCARCHQAPGFHASITQEHVAAGITCISCHTEHRGTNFSPKAAAFASCAACHNDNNKQIYRGKTVHTPHGGSFGYPLSGGKWIWAGLNEEALKLKPEVAATWKPEYDEQTWRKVQFHAIHLYRVKAAKGITGIEDGSLSCSSCHKTFGGKFDRETPRQTCANCHNGYAQQSANGLIVEAGNPNCTSCHVQHYYDDYRWGDLLTESAKDKRQRAIDRNYIEAVRRSALAQ